MSTKIQFNPEADFCSGCGTLLPRLSRTGDIACLVCKLVISSTDIKETEFTFTINFNKLHKPKEDVKESDGPVIERTCPKCGNDKMSFATLQLRSADEGQTVFFTCTKCGYKETENS